MNGGDLKRARERLGLDPFVFARVLSGLRTLDLIHGRPGGDVTIADVFRE